MSQSEFLEIAPDNFSWPRCPEAEGFISDRIQDFLKHHSFANNLAIRMKAETSTEFIVWVDHLVLPKKDFEMKRLNLSYGFVRDQKALTYQDDIPLHHPYADLPRIVLSSYRDKIACALKVESISDFQMTHGVSKEIHGLPLSPYRIARFGENKHQLFLIERRGTRGYVPSTEPVAEEYLEELEKWTTRNRHFDNDQEGMKSTLKLAQEMVQTLGTGLASWAFLEGERHYWQSRNHAGRIQKSRQDELGLGWANHDHHTFRSSRSHFPALIEILQTFGFKKRERFYAGEEAGWGAQVMEQPESRLIIFADVDLTKEDAQVDFSKEPLKDLGKPGTVGLWCALHGESMLQAGMHHLEAQFNFDHLVESLEHEKIETMAPFSDWSFLRQAFTKGESWQVEPKRLEKLKKEKMISEAAYKKIKSEGAVGSHLENLQRREGFKGFNQRGVSDIILEVNPEKQALKKASNQ